MGTFTDLARNLHWLMALCGVLAALGQATAATLQVGPLRELKAPSHAAKVAHDGDVIEIDAGIYRQDAAVWRADRLTLRGINGTAQLISEGVTAQGKAIWVIVGNDITIENVAFQGARVPSRNGAGIRQEGRNLTLRHCVFRDNENGILAGANRESDILIEHSEFVGNGHGDGRSHNIYIGAIRSFTLRDSHSHLAKVGHQVKSRAQLTRILNNRLSDDDVGRSSYLIDLPNGGDAVIRGNLMQQGPLAENGTMISFGAENRFANPSHLLVEDNTLVNERPQGCRILFVAPKVEPPARVTNNRFIGCTRMDGPVDATNNEILKDDLSSHTEHDWPTTPR